jgi:ribosomal protein S8E
MQNMSTHSSLRKRKLSGGKKRAYRSKKKYEAGGYPAETILGEPEERPPEVWAESAKLRS